MGHPSIDNRTPFAFETLFVNDEGARPVAVTLVQATYDLGPRGPVLAEQQAPVRLAGELYGDDPATSSYRYEAQIAFVKLATDVVLIGHAHALRRGTTESEVRFTVGPLEKRVAVFGDRFWVKSAGAIVMSRPLAFEQVPLRWENAFGGWDRTARDPERAQLEQRNPVGTGYRSKRGTFEEGVMLPNLEDPAHLISSHGQTPPPAGFGFVSPGWQPRAALGGTYDEAWTKDRMPLLPKDFDRRFFNAAATGLVAPGYLRGDEQVTVTGATREGATAFRLPGAGRPVCRVEIARRSDAIVQTQLDTVIVDLDDRKLTLIWRGYTELRSGPHDVVAIEVAPDAASLTARPPPEPAEMEEA